MKRIKSLLQLWWSYLNEEDKEIINEAGECLLLLIAVAGLMTATLLLPYLLRDYLPIN